MPVDDQVVLVARPRAVDRRRPGVSPLSRPARASRRSRTRPRPADRLCAARPGALRADGATLRPRSSPAAAARPSPHAPGPLGGHVPPAHVLAQHVHDAPQGGAVVRRQTPRIPLAPRRAGRQQWSDTFPQVIRHKTIRHPPHSAVTTPDCPALTPNSFRNDQLARKARGGPGEEGGLHAFREHGTAAVMTIKDSCDCAAERPRRPQSAQSARRAGHRSQRLAPGRCWSVEPVPTPLPGGRAGACVGHDGDGCGAAVLEIGPNGPLCGRCEVKTLRARAAREAQWAAAVEGAVAAAESA